MDGIGLNSDEKAFETRDSRLAAALMAVGVRPMGAEPVRIVTHAHESGEKFQFAFAPRSECGRYQTASLVMAWHEGEGWIEKNPDHPFAYAMATIVNHRRLIDFVKRAERLVCLQRGKSMALLPLNASLKLEEEVLGKFERATH